MKKAQPVYKVVKEQFKKIYYSESHSEKPAIIKMKEPIKSVFVTVTKQSQNKNDLRGC
tara:strand:+ start:707 stop:880 length:174 start_codon:yes stop_codon:yes gene_type:complete